MDLAQKKCVPCEGGTKPLTKEEAIRLISELKATWELDDASTKIRCEFVMESFPDAISFVAAIGAIAEEEGHHPDIHIFYTTVIIELWTHAIRGLSENDFILAAKIEQVFAQRSYKEKEIL